MIDQVTRVPLRPRVRPSVRQRDGQGVLLEDKEKGMQNEFTAIFERDGEWYIAYCAEIPGANGQGRTKEEARQNLAEAIALILADRREGGDDL